MEEVKTVCREIPHAPQYPGPPADPSSPSVLTEQQIPGTRETEPHAHLYPQVPRTGYAPSTLEPAPRSKASGAEYFIQRPAILDQAIKDVKTMLSPTEDGDVESVWILTE